jgi:hypothetical protein
MSEGSAKDVRSIFLPQTAFLAKMCAIYGGSANKKAKQNFFHLITNVLPRYSQGHHFHWWHVFLQNTTFSIE